MDTLGKSVIPKKDGSRIQTHTWFRNKPILKLHMGETEVQKVRKELYKLATLKNFDTEGSESANWNAISEKVPPNGIFRMFLDLDWKLDQVQGNKQLETDIKDVIKLFSAVMNDLVGETIEYLVASRLTYKVHVYFPRVIVHKDIAAKIAHILDQSLKENKPNMYFDKVIDGSVYATGLRMLWCHKGAFVNEKNANERQNHEKVFGNTYKNCYHLVDPETLKPLKRERKHLEVTSILTNETKLTELPGLAKHQIDILPKKRGRPLKQQVVHSGGIGENGEAAGGDIAERNDFPCLVSWIESHYHIDLNCAIKVYKSSRTITFGTKDHQECPFVERSHHGNNVYVRIDDKKGCRKMCHDPDCKDKEDNVVSFDDIPTDAQNDFYRNLGIVMYNEHQKLEMFEKQVQSSCKKDHPKSNFDVNYEKSEIFPRGGLKAKLLDLYCVKCNKEHEDPQAYLICNLDGLVNFECIKQYEGAPYPLTKLPPTVINNVFQGIINITVNNTVNNYAVDNSLESRDFGSFEQFPSIMESRDLDLLCYQSLSGDSSDVSKLIVNLLQGRYICIKKTWYKYVDSRWKICSGPDIFVRDELAPIYSKLTNYFNNPKQIKWIESLIHDLKNFNLRKPFIEDTRILMEDEEIVLDDQPNLIPFRNGVFDSKVCEFRKHRYEDYISEVIKYDLPSESDKKIRAEISKFFEDILPKEDVRKFLLLYLALHLEGINRQQRIVILTGSGGNGKGMLKRLMYLTFGHLHTEPSATFLTSERPSDEKASANMVDLQNKRSVWASEPEGSKKINGSFIKFLVGGDIVKCRPLHSNEWIEYLPKFQVTLLCNAIPVIDGAQDDVNSIKRRLIIVDFPIEFKRPQKGQKLKAHQKLADTSLSQKMESWGPEMMLYLIEIYKEYVENGYRFDVPDSVCRRVDEELENANPLEDELEEFMAEYCTEKSNGLIHIHKLAELYGPYIQRKFNEKHPRVIKTNVMRELLSRSGYQVTQEDENHRISECCRTPKRCLKHYILTDSL